MRTLMVILIMVIATLPELSEAQSTGSPLLDASSLAVDVDRVENATSATADKIKWGADIFNTINSYLPANAKAKSYRDLLSQIADDTVLVSALPSADKFPGSFADSVLNPGNATTVNPPSRGNAQGLQLPSATTAVDGLATFIASRFKQELEMAYLDKFKNELANNKALAALLPNTLKVLGQNDPFQYTTFLETLKEALEKDIKALPTDFGNFMTTDPLKLANTTPAYYPLLLIYQETLKILNRGNVPQILSTLDQDALVAKMQSPYKSFVQLIAIVSRNLMNPAQPNNPAWITQTNIQTVLDNGKYLQLFIGVLCIRERDELKNMTFGKYNLYQLINKNWATVAPLGIWIGNITTTYQKILADSKNLSAIHAIKSDTIPSGDSVASYSKDVVQTLNLVFDCPFIDTSGVFQQYPVVRGLFASMPSWVQMPSEIAAKNYGLALTDVLDVLTAVMPNSKTVAAIFKYGNFAVSISKATNASDFDEALESAALPVGSYAVKRHSYKNISVNAYAGVFGAIQYYPGNIPASVIKQNTLLGFTAPVGIAYSWGNCYWSAKKKDSLNGSSNTIFLSVIDIGSVTSFRLTHDSTATLPDFKWTNVLAPGIFYIYGFAKSPISIGGGVQYGPQLRSVTNNTAEIIPSAVTYRVFALVDIPLLNLFTRTELK